MNLILIGYRGTGKSTVAQLLASRLEREILEALKPAGLIFWLTATVDTISHRIADDTQRPSLTTGKTFTEEIEEVLKERTPKYEAAADFVVETDACSANQVANQVLTFFQEAQGLET